MKGKRASSGETLRRELAPARRAQLARIRGKIEAGQQLEREERRSLLHLIDELDEGYDPRAALGITPRAGALPWAAPFHRAMALQYWLLRDRSGEKDAIATMTVARAWKVSQPLVRKYSRQYRDAARSYIRQTIPEPVDADGACKLLAERWSTPDHRCSVEDVSRIASDERIFRALRQHAEALGSHELLAAFATLEADRTYRARAFAVVFERGELQRMFAELRDSDT